MIDSTLLPIELFGKLFRDGTHKLKSEKRHETHRSKASFGFLVTFAVCSAQGLVFEVAHLRRLGKN